MTDSRTLIKSKATTGDDAVDGLFSGIQAGLLMLVYLFLAGLVYGDNLSTLLGRFTLAENAQPLSGILTHVAVSGVYGVIFALAFRALLQLWKWAGHIQVAIPLGLVYGLGLWLAANFILLPGSQSPLKELPPVHFAIAHLCYGAALSLMIFTRKQQSKD